MRYLSGDTDPDHDTIASFRMCTHGIKSNQGAMSAHSMTFVLFIEEQYTICRSPDRTNSNFPTFTQFFLYSQNLSPTDC